MPNDKKLTSLKNRYKLFFNAVRDIPEPVPVVKNSVEGTYPLLEKAELESSLEGIYPVLREIMDANRLQKLNEAKDMSDQKV